MIWTILTGIGVFFLGVLIGINVGSSASVKHGFVGYYDVGSTGKVYFDPKVSQEDIYNKEFIVLECVDLTNPINAKKEN